MGRGSVQSLVDRQAVFSVREDHAEMVLGKPRIVARYKNGVVFFNLERELHAQDRRVEEVDLGADGGLAVVDHLEAGKLLLELDEQRVKSPPVPARGRDGDEMVNT